MEKNPTRFESTQLNSVMKFHSTKAYGSQKGALGWVLRGKKNEINGTDGEIRKGLIKFAKRS